MTDRYDIDVNDIKGIFKQPGRLRGVVLCTDAKYVLKHYSPRALSKAEVIAAELGYPICYDSIKTMAWYPAVLRGISLLAIAKALDFEDDNLRRMGWAAPRNSIITKLMMRYFASLRMLIDKLPAYWRRNYDVGSLSGKLYEQEAEMILEGLEIPPQLFPYLEGYFTSVVSMVIGNEKNIRIKNIEQLHGENTCYKLLVRWKNNY